MTWTIRLEATALVICDIHGRQWPHEILSTIDPAEQLTEGLLYTFM
jgi:hypothetical protein